MVRMPTIHYPNLPLVAIQPRFNDAVEDRWVVPYADFLIAEGREQKRSALERLWKDAELHIREIALKRFGEDHVVSLIEDERSRLQEKEAFYSVHIDNVPSRLSLRQDTLDRRILHLELDKGVRRNIRRNTRRNISRFSAEDCCSLAFDYVGHVSEVTKQVPLDRQERLSLVTQEGDESIYNALRDMLVETMDGVGFKYLRREVLHATQSQMAIDVCCSFPMISYLEQGKKRGSDAMRRRLIYIYADSILGDVYYRKDRYLVRQT